LWLLRAVAGDPATTPPATCSSEELTTGAPEARRA
jgi:hypothetical protein